MNLDSGISICYDAIINDLKDKDEINKCVLFA